MPKENCTVTKIQDMQKSQTDLKTLKDEDKK